MARHTLVPTVLLKPEQNLKIMHSNEHVPDFSLCIGLAKIWTVNENIIEIII